MISVTLVIIIITCITSFLAFNNDQLMDKLIFYPPAVSEDKQFYRFFSCGLIHANFMHLIFNMYSLWIFGEWVEAQFMNAFGLYGKWFYLAMYVSSLYVCPLPTYSKNKTNYNYRSLGASGAVSAVVFSFIFLDPLRSIGLVFLPGIMIPGFIFGFLYLVISSYMDNRGGGNINHSAHIWGALYAISFLIVMGSIFSRVPLLQSFLSQVRYYFATF